MRWRFVLGGSVLVFLCGAGGCASSHHEGMRAPEHALRRARASARVRAASPRAGARPSRAARPSGGEGRKRVRLAENSRESLRTDMVRDFSVGGGRVLRSPRGWWSVTPGRFLMITVRAPKGPMGGWDLVRYDRVYLDQIELRSRSILSRIRIVFLAKQVPHVSFLTWHPRGWHRSADGRCFAVEDRTAGRLVLRVYDLLEHMPPKEFRLGSVGAVRDLDVRLSGGCGYLGSRTSKGAYTVWNVKSGRVVRRYRLQNPGDSAVLHGRGRATYVVRYSSQGKTAVGFLLTGATGRCMQRPLIKGLSAADHSGELLLWCGKEGYRLYDAPSGRLLPCGWCRRNRGRPHLSPDGKFVVLSAPRKARRPARWVLLRVRDGRLLSWLRRDQTRRVTYLQGQKRVAIMGRRWLRVVDLPTGRVAMVRHVEGWRLDPATTGRYALLWRKGRMRLLDQSTGMTTRFPHICSKRGHEPNVAVVGGQVWVGYGNAFVHDYDGIHAYSLRTGRELDQGPSWAARELSLRVLLSALDVGGIGPLVAGGTTDGRVVVWDGRRSRKVGLVSGLSTPGQVVLDSARARVLVAEVWGRVLEVPLRGRSDGAKSGTLVADGYRGYLRVDQQSARVAFVDRGGEVVVSEKKGGRWRRVTSWRPPGVVVGLGFSRRSLVVAVRQDRGKRPVLRLFLRAGGGTQPVGRPRILGGAKPVSGVRVSRDGVAFCAGRRVVYRSGWLRQARFTSVALGEPCVAAQALARGRGVAVTRAASGALRIYRLHGRRVSLARSMSGIGSRARVALGPGGRHLAAGNRTGRIRVVDLASAP